VIGRITPLIGRIVLSPNGRERLALADKNGGYACDQRTMDALPDLTCDVIGEAIRGKVRLEE
jgi:hypothetical protein